MAPDPPASQGATPGGDPLAALVEHAWDRLKDSPASVNSAGRADFVATFLGVLRQPGLTAAEGEVVAGLSDLSPASELDRLLTLRVQHALERACEAAGLGDDGGAARLVARTVVARGDGERAVAPTASHGAESALGQLARTIDFDEAEFGHLEPLVFTNRGGEVELEQTRETALRAGLPISDSQSFDVLEMTEALEALEAHVLEAAPVEAQAALSALARGDDLIGETLNGKYLVTGRLGKGGFGTVYQATDLGFAEELGETSGARVAIKVLNANVQKDRKAIRRFLEEANRLTLLNHPNIVQWITFDKTPDGIHFFVMEFLEGRELAEILSVEKQMDPMRVGALLVDVLAALERAHGSVEAGALLHLDLKPQNIFVLGAAELGAETAKVIDFGIGQNVGNELADVGAVALDDDADVSEVALERTVYPSLGPEHDPADDPAGEAAHQANRPRSPQGSTSFSTLDGQVRRARGGTVLYSSPEQCRHLRRDDDIVSLDGRSDLYSLGVVGFKALTGAYPFARKATSLREAYEQHLNEPPRRVRDVRPRVPRRLAAVVDRCLEKDRGRRFGSAREARVALERAMQPLVSRSFLIGASFMLLPLIGLFLHWLFKAPEYEQINTIQLLRESSMGDRAMSVASFPNDRPLEIASDNVGPPFLLSFEDGLRPRGVPRLHLGEDSLDHGAPASPRVVLREEADGRYALHSLQEAPLPATSVFVRWDEALVATPPFWISTLAPLPPIGVRATFAAFSAAEDLTRADTPPLIWAESPESIFVEITGAEPGSLLQFALQDTATGKSYGLVRYSGEVDVMGTLSPSRLDMEFGPARTFEGTYQLTALDRAGRTVVGGAPFRLRFTNAPTEIMADSIHLDLYGSSSDAPLASTRLRLAARDEPIALTDAVTRAVIRGRVEPAEGRAATVRLSGTLGAASASVVDGAFAFDVSLDDIVGGGDGRERREDASSLGFSLRINVVDSGLLKPDEGAGPSFVSSVTFARQTELALELQVQGGERQGLRSGAVVFAAPGPASVQLPNVEADVLFGLFSIGAEGPGLVGHARGGEVAFEASASAAFELRMFDGSVVQGAASEAETEGVLASLTPGAALMTIPFELRVLGELGLQRIGFPSRLEPRFASATLAPEDLPSLEVELEEPMSLRRVETRLLRNGEPVLSRQFEAGALASERRGSIWAIVPGQWGRGLFGGRGWDDGDYVIDAALEDGAGHRIEIPNAARFAVAAEPPRLEPASVETGGFEKLVVRLVATDENGIVWEPMATFEIEGKSWPMALVSGRPSGASAMGDPPADSTEDPDGATLVESIRRAELRFELPLVRSMSRKSGTVTVTVQEALGGEATTWTEVVELGRVREALPARVAVDEDRGSSAMVLVRGPAGDGDYVIAEGSAGRTTALRERFAASGVPYLESDRGYRNFIAQAATFFPTTRPIGIDSDALLDFYLDETEVTEAQFLRFVSAKDGYRDVQNWPLLRRVGAVGLAAEQLGRRGEWEARLLASPGRESQPVTGVLWEEAAAYASWAGKRLPTLLEWEYAVRGESGRLFAVPDGAPGEPRAFLSAEGELADVRMEAFCSSEGLYHLCGNVAEWTQTSYWKSQPTLPFRGEDATFCANHVNGGTTIEALVESFMGNRTDLYGRDGPFFFVVGAGWAPGKGSWRAYGLPMAPHDFRVVDRLPLGPRWKGAPGAPRVGFRCARSASGI